MAIFSDGFESGDFSAWTSFASYGVTSWVANAVDQKHHGSYSAKVTGLLDLDDYAYARKTFTEISEGYMRTYIRFLQHFSDSSSVYAILLFINSADQHRALMLRRGIGDNSYYWSFDGQESATFTLSPGTWYCLEIGFRVNTSTGFRKLWVDGVLTINQTNVNTGSNNLVQARIEAWHSIADSNVDQIWFDCVVIDTSYIGPEAAGPTIKKGSNLASTMTQMLHSKTLFNYMPKLVPRQVT